MNIRGGIGALERAIRDTQERAAREDEARRKSAELAEHAEAEKRSAADDPSAFDAASERARRHRQEVERLEVVAERIAADLVELEERLAIAKYEESRAALETALARQHDASKKVASATTSLGKACSALTAARDEVDSALKAARAACPPDLDFAEAGPDEPSWPDASRIVETLSAGPRRPFARSAAHRQRLDREQAVAEGERIPPAVKEAIELGDFDRLRRLPASSLPAAIAFAERDVSERSARVPEGKAGREIVDVLERRLGRIRALANQVDDAATVAL